MASTKSAGLRLFRQGGLYTLGLFLMRAGNLLLLPLYTALLSREEYGAFGVVKHLVNLLVILAIAGQSHALIRLGTDAEQDSRATGKLLSSVFTWVGSAALLFTVITALLWNHFGDVVEGVSLWPVGLAGIALLAGQACFQLTLAWLQFRGRAALHTKLNIGRWVAMMALIFVFLIGLGWKAEGLLLATGVSFTLGAAWGIRYLRRQGLGLGIDGASIKASLKYGIPILPHALAGIIFQATDQVLLAAHADHGLNVAGMYLLAAQLGAAVFMVAMGMQRAWLPFFLRADRDREQHGFAQVRVLSFFSVVAVGAVAVGVGLLAPEVVYFASYFAQGTYAPAAAVVPVLAFGAFVRCYYLVASAVVMSNKQMARWIAAATLPGAALNIWLNARWIPEHGMQGAAWATMTSHAVTAVLGVTLARVARKVPFKYAHAAVLLVLVGATLLIGRDQSLPIRIALGIGFGALVYLLDRRDIGSAARSVIRQRRARREG